MKIFIPILISFVLNACMENKPIANREIEISPTRESLEFGDNWNNLDVSKPKVIKRIKYRRADFFYDK